MTVGLRIDLISWCALHNPLWSFPMSSLLQDVASASPAERLRATMAAARLSFVWFGVRKTLTPQQKSHAADAFGAEGAFLSAGKKLLDTRHDAFRACRQAVHEELARHQAEANTGQSNGANTESAEGRRRGSLRMATWGQTRALDAIAQRRQLDLASVVAGALWRQPGRRPHGCASQRAHRPTQCRSSRSGSRAALTTTFVLQAYAMRKNAQRRARLACPLVS
jgi:hypothetical protein